jgi:hypothetical protein
VGAVHHLGGAIKLSRPEQFEPCFESVDPHFFFLLRLAAAK